MFIVKWLHLLSMNYWKIRLKKQQYAIIPKFIDKLNNAFFCHQTGIWWWQPFNIPTVYLYLWGNWLEDSLAQASLWIIKTVKPNFPLRDFCLYNSWCEWWLWLLSFTTWQRNKIIQIYWLFQFLICYRKTVTNELQK